jgi:hypothetical protein
MIVATLFALRLRAEDGLGILLSAKVNQLDALVGSLWIPYTLAAVPARSSDRGVPPHGDAGTTGRRGPPGPAAREE